MGCVRHAHRLPFTITTVFSLCTAAANSVFCQMSVNETCSSCLGGWCCYLLRYHHPGIHCGAGGGRHGGRIVRRTSPSPKTSHIIIAIKPRQASHIIRRSVWPERRVHASSIPAPKPSHPADASIHQIPTDEDLSPVSASFATTKATWSLPYETSAFM